jgi:tRNA A-37 threonylcarbamoyl transferase component Bud32
MFVIGRSPLLHYNPFVMSPVSPHHNPFFNRQRITDPAYFYGRARELEALYSAVATRQCRSLVGERKLGKSSLLTHLANPPTLRAHGLDPAQYVFIYTDLEGMANINYDEFWPELLDRLESALPADQEALRRMTREVALSAEVRFMQVRRLLRRVERAGLTVVLMLDEFESLAANDAFTPAFYGELRSLAGEMGVVYLTASKRSLYDLTFRHAETLSSPFFNIFSEQRLGLLPDTEAKGLLCHLSALGDGDGISPSDCDFLVDLAGPHPFFLQIAGYYRHLELEDRQATGEIQDRVQHRFEAEAEDHYRYLWSQLSEEEQEAVLDSAAADSHICHRLQSKALLRPSPDGRTVAFSRAFGAFLTRSAANHEPVRRSERTSQSSLTGTTLGSYRVLNVVGQGGMAVVYKGYQPSLDRYVAVKVMSRHLVYDQTFLDRFQREAAGVAQLRHQNLVQMLDFGVQKDLSYMVMEYIDGDTLKSRMARCQEEGGRLAMPEVMEVIHDVAAALDYAHAHGIVHRDVKPANVMLRREERLARLTGAAPFTAVLTDFGVARMLEGLQLTGEGATIGTPDYMSPEQARGEPAQSASDIYSLGVMLYEMLTGQLPFTADSPVAVLLQHIQADPPPATLVVPELPRALEWVLMQALAKRPQDRFTTAGKMAAALSQAVGV